MEHILGNENIFEGLGDDTDREAAEELRREAQALRAQAETESDSVKKAELLEEAKELESRARDLWQDAA